MPIWINDDGLEVRFGIDRVTSSEGGVTLPEEKVFVWTVTGTDLADTDTSAADGDQAFIPAGAIVKDAYFVVDTAFTSGGSAVLDLGFKEADGTNIDDDGIDAAVAVAALTANAAVASDGALIGTRLANDSYVMATYDTAAFTAGVGKLYIKYFTV